MTRPLSTRSALMITGAAALVAAVIILWQYRGLTFFYDEWDFIQNRRGWSPGVFLQPHNEHLHLIPVFLFKVLFTTVGLTSYWPYAVLLVMTHLACAGVLFALIRAWSTNEVAVIGTIVMLFLGTAWQVIMWPFEISVTISLATGLAALLALNQRSARADAAACVLLAASLASASLAIPFVVGALLLLLMQRGPIRRGYVIAVPAVLYGAWYLAYGHSTAKMENIREVPVFVADSAAGALGALFGLTTEYGRVLVVLAIATVAVALIRRWNNPQPLVLACTIALILWATLCLSRFGAAPADTSRYLYPGVALMILAGAALLARRPLTTSAARGVALVLLAASLITNVGMLAKGAGGLRDTSERVLASAGAMTESRAFVAPDFPMQPQLAPTVQASGFFAATDALGSPAWTASEIAQAPLSARAEADDTLRRAGALEITSAPRDRAGDHPPPLTSLTSGAAHAGPGPGCQTIVANPDAIMTLTADLPPRGLLITSRGSTAEIRAARFADLGGDPLARIAPNEPATLVHSRLVSPTPPWRLQVASGATVILCTA